jgi:hypothetical protein
MHRQWIGAALLAGLAIATAGALSAQQRQLLAPGAPSIMQEEQDDAAPAAAPPPTTRPSRSRGQAEEPAYQPDPDLDSEDQLAPSQIRQPMPAAVAMPSSGDKLTRAAAHSGEEPDTATRPARGAKAYVIACDGLFGRDSSQLKLAAAFRSRNVAITQVDAASGAKVTASVLFGNDPKRRLEVWWSNPESRSDTHLIVINGQSDWIAPGKLHLGLTLAELEQLNGKPFKLLGFNKDSVATLSDWNGGSLSALPGGCKIGVSLRADAKTPTATIRAVPADRAFTSSDAALRAANPTISEILVAY